MTDIDELVKRLARYALRTGYDYQDGNGTNAPAIIFADADYEVGDGKCGLHETVKSANEPAIIYVRADSLTALAAENERLREALADISSQVSWEINPSNYTHDEVCQMNSQFVLIGNAAAAALTGKETPHD